MTLKAFVFDVFGTCVDWQTSVEKQLAAFLTERGLDASRALDMTLQWRKGYYEYCIGVGTQQNKEPYTLVDLVHRRLIKSILADSMSYKADETELDKLQDFWHKLEPHADTSEGIRRLKRKAITSTLSNGNMRLLVDMSKHADMQWDLIMSGELWQSTKPDPRVYRGAAEMLLMDYEEVVMVACHFSDLEYAKKAGLRTAFIYRPGESEPELGPGQMRRDGRNEPYIDYVVETIGELADLIT
ncbi:HAD-like domain-containing protein [Protomyces lactucae-debilis]|uniref:HAD-like domain-containing protein n=1 Tax=Protomyces lactucae-debilis TaxID=2754530 RepID=A0A1Y2FU35_PROLT|nr:HAD-like domain-containing protein [Protomyces lactucae-debilis]ORY87531.1 HAD-like domain-containing protein [Protomyces lactucae-debilis]